ncbi:MAG TPA: SEC-C domain-containing protein [Thermoanaerobaculia bacterium]|nr:SEC-C domain-containing protein [Thermoanaerobaculia bacterium]
MDPQALFPFFRSRKNDAAGIEWLGGRYQLEDVVEIDGHPVHPEVILWLELPQEIIVDLAAADPRDAVSLAESLRSAMAAPKMGKPRRPARIRVADANLARELEAESDLPPVIVAPTPELDILFDDLAASFRKESGPSYLDIASPPALLHFFTTAERFLRARPWKIVGPEQVIGADIPALGVEWACISIIESPPGMALFRSWEVFEETLVADEDSFMEAISRFAGNEDDEPIVRVLAFEPEKTMPERMVREGKDHGWPVFRKQWPLLMVVGPDGKANSASEGDLRLMTAVMAASLELVREHRSLFEETFPSPLIATYRMEGIEVMLSAPFEPEPEESLQEIFPPDVTPIRGPRAGRNDPCPCGSGRKYKKCHLAADEREGVAIREKAGLHVMDYELVREIHRFAERDLELSLTRLTRVGRDDATITIILPWLAWHARIGDDRVADTFVARRGSRLSERERSWFEAQRKAWLSVWEIRDVRPGTIDLVDLLTGERRQVTDLEASRTLVRRDAILARIVDLEDQSVIAGYHGRTLGPGMADEIVEEIRKRLGRKREHLDPARLRELEAGVALIELWDDAFASARDRRSASPKLQNTDGDPLLMVTDTYDLTDGERETVEELLMEMEGLEPRDDLDLEPGMHGYTATRPGNRMHASWDNTVVGNLRIGETVLIVEANSKKRATALRRRIEKALGDRIRFRMRETEDHRDWMDRSARVEAPPEDSPEAQEMIRTLKEQHYAAWIDEPIPALGGKTPREAAKRAKSRKELDLLLRAIERGEQLQPEETRFDVRRLRSRLGLED